MIILVCLTISLLLCTYSPFDYYALIVVFYFLITFVFRCYGIYIYIYILIYCSKCGTNKTQRWFVCVCIYIYIHIYIITLVSITQLVRPRVWCFPFIFFLSFFVCLRMRMSVGADI